MKIGIISAMLIEVEYILKHISFKEIHLKKNTFFSATYEGIELILVSTGVGKVNAATYTQILIENFSPAYVINVGIAGGLNEKLKPLEIVIGSSYSHHDVNITQMENLFPKTSVFSADPYLLELFTNNNIKGLTGPIVSGETFISDTEERKMIIDKFQAIAVDMETSAMAHTCFINDIPFISLRGISDLANDDADISYDINEASASDQVGEMLLRVLKLSKLSFV